MYKNKLFKRGLLFATLVLFVGAGAVTTTPRTIYVDDDAPPEWYDSTHVQTIQQGVDSALVGDTVFVYNGTYYDDFEINKRVNLIGENRDSTIIDAQNSGRIATVIANWVTISGFTIENAPYCCTDLLYIRSDYNTISGNIISNNPGWAVCLEGSFNTITDNILKDNWYVHTHDNTSNNTISNNTVINSPIYIYSSYQNIVSENTITSGTAGGRGAINVEFGSCNNIISRNTIKSRYGCAGVFVYQGSSRNTITDNTISSDTSGDFGIRIQGSSSNIIANNHISDHYYGIDLVGANNNSVDSCTSKMNTSGIRITGGKDNIITLSVIDSNQTGVYIENGDSNLIKWCKIKDNTGYGMELVGSSNISIYHNDFIGNNGATSVYDTAHIQAYDDSLGANFWNANYPLGGNYWSDYNGSDDFSGAGQNIPGSDGIGDTPYPLHPLEVGNRDNYPLMNPWPLVCGDVDYTGTIDIIDVVYLVNYKFRSGPEPIPHQCAGDVNGDGITNIVDIVYLVNYLFKTDVPPVSGCCE